MIKVLPNKLHHHNQIHHAMVREPKPPNDEEKFYNFQLKNTNITKDNSIRLNASNIPELTVFYQNVGGLTKERLIYIEEKMVNHNI